jgi:hypothetical protein
MTVASAPALSELECLVREFKRREAVKKRADQGGLQAIFRRNGAVDYTVLAGVLAAAGTAYTQATARETNAFEPLVADSLEDLLALAEYCDPAGLNEAPFQALETHEHAARSTDDLSGHDNHAPGNRSNHLHHGEYVSPLMSRIFEHRHDQNDHEDHHRRSGHDRAHETHIAHAGGVDPSDLSGHDGHGSHSGPHQHATHAGHSVQKRAGVHHDHTLHGDMAAAHDHFAAAHGGGVSHGAHASHASHAGHAGHMGQMHAGHGGLANHGAHGESDGAGVAGLEALNVGEHRDHQGASDEHLLAHAEGAHDHENADDPAGAFSLAMMELGSLEDLSVVTVHEI